MLPGYQNPRKKNETYHAHVDLHCPHCNPCRPAIRNGLPRHGIAGYPGMVSGVSGGGILGYPGVVSWGIRGYPGYPPTIRRIAVPKRTQITMAPVTRKGILGGGSKCYIILEGSQRHFGATWRTSTCSNVCTRATLVPSPPRPLHSIISNASF